MEEFIAYAKANPGKVTWATHGMGAAQHLTGEMFNKTAGIEMTAVHYQGSAPGTLDMVGGRVDLMYDGAGTGLANVRSGQLKAIAMGSDTRATGAPDLPTWKEKGVNFSAYTWYGIFVPVGTPQPIMDKLHKAITVALDSKPYRGATGSGAELGHIVLDPDGPPCGCGGHGHLESFAADLGLADVVQFLGGRKDIVALIQCYDVFLLTSIIEGMPNVVMESQLLGVPVVATKAGGTVDLIQDGETGLLAPVGDHEQLASGIVRLFTETGLRDRISLRARDQIRNNYTVEQFVARTESVYRRLTSKDECGGSPCVG